MSSMLTTFCHNYSPFPSQPLLGSISVWLTAASAGMFVLASQQPAPVNITVAVMAVASTALGLTGLYQSTKEGIRVTPLHPMQQTTHVATAVAEVSVLNPAFGTATAPHLPPRANVYLAP